MFGRHKVAIPSGVKAIVRGRVVSQSPLHVSSDDLVYFISLVPDVRSFSGQAACKEGIVHKVTIQAKLALLDGELDSLLSDAGHSSYPKFVTITAQERADRFKMPESLRAAIQTYIQGQSLFALQKEDSVKQALQPLLQALCQEARLNITIEACSEITHVEPSDAQLAELATRAGKRVSIDEAGALSVVYADREMGMVVEYFDKARREQDERDLEAHRQKGMNDVSIERTRAENEVAIERTKAEAGPELERLRQQTFIEQTTSKIRAQDEEHRLKAHEAELRRQEQQWESEAIKRNSDLMELRAQYESAYKERRLNEEREFQQARLEAERNQAGMKAEIAQATEMELETVRRQKQLDVDLQIAQDRRLMEIRTEEMAQMAQYVGTLFEKISLPVPDYAGVHTLILGADGSKSGDLFATLLMELLSRFVDVSGSRNMGIAFSPKISENSLDSH
jgi:hypothetical protein